MLVDRNRIYSGKLLDLIVDTTEVKGRRHIWEVVRHPGGAVILAEGKEGRILFVRQFRYPMEKALLELPAGKIDPGEESKATAARELEEETGFRAECLEHVLGFYSSPGFCDELLHLYHARRLRPTGKDPQPDEEITVEFHSLEEAIQLSLRGEITDAKTLLALFWLDWKRRTP